MYNLSNICNISIYDHLIRFTYPFALEHSDLEEDEVLDYIHDFLLDLHDNRVRWIDGERFGTYDLEKLNNPTIISRFFFQYVERARMMEGRWVDRRILGRRTQQEKIKGCDLTPHHAPPPMSYEMHLKGDCEQFIQSLSEDERAVLNSLVREELLKDRLEATGISYNIYRKIRKKLQMKAKEHLM